MGKGRTKNEQEKKARLCINNQMLHDYVDSLLTGGRGVNITESVKE